MLVRLLAVTLLTFAATFSAAAAEIVVEIEGLRSRKGVVRIGLYDREAAFPKKQGQVMHGAVTLGDGPASYVFHELAPGTYAISLYHDENTNDKFDFTWLGMPDEGYGFSNGARARFSAPSFTDAAIVVGPGGKSISIKLSYW